MATPTNLPASFVTGAVLTAAQQNGLRGAFRILQVVQGSATATVVSTSSTWVDTNLTATITPQSTSSLVLVVYSQNTFSSTATTGMGWRLVRGATTLDTIVDISFGTGSGNLSHSTASFLDSPASTSALTYKTQMNLNTGAGIVYSQPNFNRSSILLFEVSA
jgi:hypothetical protein